MTIGKICLCLVAPPPASTKQLRVSYKGTRSPVSWLGLWKYKSMKIHSRLYPPPALLSPPSCISCIYCDGIFIPSAYSKGVFQERAMSMSTRATLCLTVQIRGHQRVLWFSSAYLYYSFTSTVFNNLKDAGCFKSKESADSSSLPMAVLCSPSNCQWCRCTAIDAPCSTFSYEAFDKECGETDVPVIVVKGLFSHPGDVALNEYFILTFFNTITGLSLTHCYLWSVEFTKWDKLGIWYDCLLVIGHKMSDEGRLFERTNLTWEVFWVSQRPEQHLVLYHPKCPFGFITGTRRSIDHHTDYQ